MLVDRARIRRRTYVFVGAWQEETNTSKIARVRKQVVERNVP